jgi:enterobacterial common antigen flippase
MKTDATSLPSSRNFMDALLRGDRPMFAMFQTLGTQGLILCANLATGIVMARLLGPDGRGEFTAVSLWPQLLAMLAVAGMNGALVYRLRRSPADAPQIVGAAVLASSAFALFATISGMMILPFALAQYDSSVIWFAELCLISVFVNTLTMVIKQACAGVGRFTRGNAANLLPQVMHLVVLLAVLPFAMLTPKLAVLALLGAGLISLVLILPGFIRTLRPRFAGALKEIPALLSFSGRGSINDLVFALSMYLDRLVLIPLLPPAQLGLYVVAFSFSRLLQFAQTAITSVFLSQLSAVEPAQARELHDRALRFLVAAMIGACFVLWFVGEALLSFAFGADFVAANPIFRLLAAEAALGIFSQVTVQLFFARGRPGVVSTLQLGTLGISLAGLLVFTPLYGATGAAAALVVAGAVRWIALLIAARIVLKQPFPRLLLGRDDLTYLSGRLR